MNHTTPIERPFGSHAQLVVVTSLLLSLVAAMASAEESRGTVDLPFGYPETARRKTSINQDWQFHLGEAPGAHEADHDDSSWQTVHLPHTLKLTSLALDHVQDDKYQKTFQRQVGWYRRKLMLTRSPDRKVFLEFEGAHQVTDAWVNGRKVGRHAIGGYTPFHFDITDLVHSGTNAVAIRVDNTRRDDVPPDPGPFDYVKFSGLYRDVYLVETDRVHVTFPWEQLDAGVRITTPSVDPLNGNATIDVRTTVRNESDQACPCCLLTRIIDTDGIVVRSMRASATIAPGADYTFAQCNGIEDDLHLWSCDDPYLYRVNTLVLQGERPVDCVENPLGIRKVELNKHEGMLLNGKPLKLLGVNRHQHYPYIGDAVPDSLHFRDVLQLKQAGFNMVRTAHYPQDNALLDACDRLGVLVYEEAPSWISLGNDAWFDNLERAARHMVRNHRNHPSVILWGGGINHRGAVPRLHYAIKQEDPTRWTASNNSAWTGFQGSGVCDIYSNMDYGNIDRWDQTEYLLAMEGGRGPNAVALYKSNPMRIGLLSWTAHAYYTFHPTRSPDNRMRGGMMDGFRIPGNVIAWSTSELTTQPMVYIADDWVAGTEEVTVYSNCDEVELSLGGETIARRRADTGKHYEFLSSPPFTFPIDAFKPGKLVARGFTGGEALASYAIRTPEAAQALEIEVDVDSHPLTADGSDIVLVYTRVVDRNGTTVRGGDHSVRFRVDGPASIVGDDAGIAANPMNTRDGIAPILLRAMTEPGEIVVHAEAAGLKPARTELSSIPSESDRIAALARPIYDLPHVRVDLGAGDQLVQFGWTPWTGGDDQPASVQLSAMGNVTVSLSPVSDDGIESWLGEMNVKGRNGYVTGDGVCVVDPKGLELTFGVLPQGHYRLTSYHHAPRSNTDSMDPNREKLKSLTAYKIPYARTLTISSAASEDGTTPVRVQVTDGADLPDRGPGTSELSFYASGEDLITVSLKDADGQRGIWLNGFQLRKLPVRDDGS